MTQALIDAFRSSTHTLVVTGAGISLASGIPTFRGTDEDAVWAHDVMEMGTFRYFQRDPVGSWRWYLDRFSVVEGKQPNPAHTALVELERWQVERGSSFTLVTQNIDGLHRLAGTQNLIEVHGTASRMRCSQKGCALGAPKGHIERSEVELTPFREDPKRSTLPRCPHCESALRPHVLWFDETYDGHEDYQLERVLKAAREAELILFVGTSFAVGITDLFLDEGRKRRAQMFTIDPGGLQPLPQVQVVKEKSEVTLPQVVATLVG